MKPSRNLWHLTMPKCLMSEMKHLQFNISEDQVDWLFKPIREKLHAIIVLMRVIKIMLTYHEPAETQVAGHFILTVDAMSRLLFFLTRENIFYKFPI